MRQTLINIIALLIISSSYGQKLLEICPERSVRADSVSILNSKFERDLRKRIQKYQPERKIVILWFDYEYKKNDSTLNVTLFNKKTSKYYRLVEYDNIYGYFTLDSVLFVIEKGKIPHHLFLLSKNNRNLYTEDIDCRAITVGQLEGIECTYIIKKKENKLKIRKRNDFFYKTKQRLENSFRRFARLFRRKKAE